MNGDTVGGDEQADMSESKRRFFSGDTLQQALVQAANHFHLQPEEVAFHPIDKRHGFTKTRRKVLIEVDPGAPKRAAGTPAAEGSGVAGSLASRPTPAGAEMPASEPAGAPAAASSGGRPPRAAEGASPLRGEGAAAAARTARQGREQRHPGEEIRREPRRGFGGDRGRPRRPSGSYPPERRPNFAGGDAGLDAVGEDLVALPERPRSVAERYPKAEGPQAEAAAQGVELVLRIAGLDLTPRIYRGEERLEIDLVGGDTDWCFADDGELLMAIEHLLPRIIRSLSGEGVLCRVDCDNFHEIREERLRSLAQKVADEVRQKGRARTLVPMNPADRRIIHVTLADDPAVVTESEGDGYFKRITVRPV